VPAETLACPHDLHEGSQCCLKRQMGSTAFARQYMGVVFNTETALFKPQNWRRYQAVPAGVRGAIFVDLAHEEKTSADYTVVAPIATDGTHRFWHPDLFRGRVQFPDAIRVIKERRLRHPDYPVVVEDTVNSKPLIQALRREMWGVIAWPLEGRSKRARAEAAVPSHESGDWLLPEGVGWADDLIQEHAAFPDGKHDDMVDVSSLMHAYFTRRRVAEAQTREAAKPFRRAWEVARA
jgi:predicted phage terminase large subunit-like protein